LFIVGGLKNALLPRIRALGSLRIKSSTNN
jgi:hypothetical protein